MEITNKTTIICDRNCQWKALNGSCTRKGIKLDEDGCKDFTY